MLFQVDEMDNWKGAEIAHEVVLNEYRHGVDEWAEVKCMGLLMDLYD